MIEKTILNYLSDNLSVEVYTEKPRRPISRNYVMFERTGRSETNRVITSTFAFQSYGETLLDAAELNEQVEALVNGMTTLNDVSAVELNTSYNFTDLSTKEHRYQCVFDITHY